MKIDLGNYQYCETDELEELGKIKNREAVWSNIKLKVNGTLFKTLYENYVFYGRVYDTLNTIDVINGWYLLKDFDEARRYLELCDTINNNTKWYMLKYEKV